MSVNYYLDDASKDENHIGKWSAGRFLGYAPEGVNSFNDWAVRLEGHTIVAEHGLTYTPAEMIETAKERDRSFHHSSRWMHDPNYFMDEGVEFGRQPFC